MNSLADKIAKVAYLEYWDVDDSSEQDQWDTLPPDEKKRFLDVAKAIFEYLLMELK